MMTMHANSPKQAINETFFAKFSSEQKAVNNQEKLEKLLKNNIDIIIQLHQHEDGTGKFTDAYLVKENKNYSFPDDYLLFEKEHLSSFLVHKNRPNLKKEIDMLLEKQNFVTVQDIVSKLKTTYKTAHKLIPQNILRKNVAKEKVKSLINQSPSVIYKELQKDGLDISKKHIRRVKKACLLFKEQRNEAR